MLDGDTTDDEVHAYRDQHDIYCTLLLDTGCYLDETGVFWQYGIDGIPQVFFIDEDGHVRYKEIGHPLYDPACEIDYAEAVSWKVGVLLK